MSSKGSDRPSEAMITFPFGRLTTLKACGTKQCIQSTRRAGTQLAAFQAAHSKLQAKVQVVEILRIFLHDARLSHGRPPGAAHKRWIDQVAEHQRLKAADPLPALLPCSTGCLQHLLY